MKSIVLLALVASLIFGCKNNPGAKELGAQSSEDSIRTAIQAHLAHKGTLNLQAFDTEVKQVTIQGDHAQAEVEFRVKSGPGAMQLTYALEKHEGAWSVVESDPVGSNFSHPALDQGQSPQTNGTAGASHSLADTLRSFKSGAASTPPLPPGHP
jgi:formamidopyrimidine-DNA glycosylase